MDGFTFPDVDSYLDDIVGYGFDDAVFEFRPFVESESPEVDEDKLKATYGEYYVPPFRLEELTTDFEFELPELALLDLDRKEIVEIVRRSKCIFDPIVRDNCTLDGDHPRFLAAARKIYEEGGHSKPMATLHLSAPLERSLKRFSIVYGTSSSGSLVKGWLPTSIPEGATTIEVVYDRELRHQEQPENEAPYDTQRKPPCSVGGLPNPNFEGCLATKGTIEIVFNDPLYGLGFFKDTWYEGPVAEPNTTLATLENTTIATLEYAYDPLGENTNLLTLQGLSTNAEEKHGNYNDYPMFQKYVDYYGTPDYADQWIRAFFEGTSTDMLRGNRDDWRSEFRFSNTPHARAEAITTATLAMSTWMAFVNRLEDVVGMGCSACPTCDGTQNQRNLRELEKAVALYVGTEPCLLRFYGDVSRVDFSDSKLSGLCGLAGREGNPFSESLNFAGTNVNEEILTRIELVSKDLSAGLCQPAMEKVEEIQNYMAVPLLQGMIRSAYMLAEDDFYSSDLSFEEQDLYLGRAEAYTAAVLPLVHACDAEAAEYLHREMFLENRPGDYKDIQSAVTAVLPCLGLTENDLGGIFFPVLPAPKSEEPNIGNILLVLGIVVFFLVALVSICVLAKHKLAPPKNQEKQPKQEKDETKDKEESDTETGPEESKQEPNDIEK